jgi:predicted dienelactone hydrolase
MGQAKLRGTFEQRQAVGIAKRQERERLRLEAIAARQAARKEADAKRAPEERDRSRRAALLLTSVLGMAISSSSAKGVEIARMAAEYGGAAGAR